MSNPKDSKLRIFLRQAPQPVRLRARKGDEEQDIALADQVRHRWRIAEEALTSWGAESVECLDAKGAITRSYTLVDVDEGSRERERSSLAENRAGELKGMASMLDRYGDRMCEAFDRGAAAAGTSQENLVALVEVLTAHLSHAITNLHNVSVNLANVISGKDVDEGTVPQSQAALQGLLMQVAGRMVAGAPPAQAAPPNGAKK
jgi:hypothetical protein